MIWFLRSLAVLILCGTVTAAAHAEARPKHAPTLTLEQNGVDTVLINIRIPARQSLRNLSVQIERRAVESDIRSMILVKNPKRSVALLERGLEPDTYRYRARLSNRRGRSGWGKFRQIILEPTPTPAPTSTPGSNNNPPGKPAIPSGMRECGDSAFYQQAYDRVTEIRAESESGPLAFDPRLYFAALAHSIAMAERQILSHENFIEEIFAHQAEGTSFGQNVASFHQDPIGVVNAWDLSPSHSFNMRNGKWLRIGIGCIVDSDGHFWWTQNFAK